jgi:hypothetical protein
MNEPLDKMQMSVVDVMEWLNDHAAHLRKMEEIGALGETELTPMLESAATLLEQLSDLAADAVAGMRYIEGTHGRLYGVGWDRVYAKADALKPQLSNHISGIIPESLLQGYDQAKRMEFADPPDLVEDEKLAAMIPD